MPAKKDSKTYQQLREELDVIIMKLQDPECDVDAAAGLYADALALTKQMEAHLEKAENRIRKLQAGFDGAGSSGAGTAV